MDYIEEVGEHSVHVKAKEPATRDVIQSFERIYNYGDHTWRISFESEDQLADILQHLRDHGIAFAGGYSGWPPAGVALWLRERGKIQGVIKEIVWRGPSQMEIREK